MRLGGRSDPAAGAGELDRFVAVGGAELGGCGGEVVADCAGGQGRAFGDFIDGGAACREFQDVSFAGGEKPDGRLGITLIDELDGNAGKSHSTTLGYAAVVR
jgi:hypothetical protein